LPFYFLLLPFYFFLFSLHPNPNSGRKQIHKAKFACNKNSKGKVNDEKVCSIFCDGGFGIDGFERR
jgi:hypothetical protein